MDVRKIVVKRYSHQRLNRESVFVWQCSMFLLLVMTLSIMALEAGAKTCVPPVVGVPYSGGPGPIWWDSTPTNSSAIYHRINDPRWKTSLRIGQGAGATEQVGFRALHHTSGGVKSVYMSWWINVAPIINVSQPTNHQIYLGLKPKTGTKRLFVKLEMTSSSNVANSPSNVNADVHVVGTLTNPDMVSTRIDPDPAWTARTHIWVQKLQNYSDSSITDPNMWAININLPIGVDLGNGVSLGDEFEMFYNVLTDAAELGVESGDPLIDYDWPLGTEVEVDALERKILPNVGWEEIALSSGISDPGCSTGGITIEATDIGTGHPDGPNYINPAGTNSFFARPTNITGGGVPVGNVHAKFSLANWGNEPDKFSVDPESVWTPIRGLGDVTQSPPPASTANGDQWNITGSWTPNATDDPIWFDGSRQNHQCMLVELSGPVKFLKSSVHRNMNFQPASVYRESAQVSVVGLEPVSTNPRDVYLYVQKENMPRRAQGNGSRLMQMSSSSTVSTDGVGARSEDDERSKIDKTADWMPSYVVHAYYDTGRTITRKGRTQKVLKPMTSYGYFMEHEGPLTGWRNKMEGATLVELAPEFYKVVVPNNGTTTVTNTIEAVEHGFAINLRAGIAEPHSSFNNVVSAGPSLNLGLEYLLTPVYSIEGVLGFHNFDDDGLGNDVDIAQASINVRRYFAKRVVWPFVNAGIGIYDLNNGIGTKNGYNIGLGAQYDLKPALSLEAAYNYHGINSTGLDVEFSTLQLGLRYLF